MHFNQHAPVADSNSLVFIDNPPQRAHPGLTQRALRTTRMGAPAANKPEKISPGRAFKDLPGQRMTVLLGGQLGRASVIISQV